MSSPTKDSLPSPWLEWMAENLIAGAQSEHIVAALSAQGVRPDVARTHLEGLRRDLTFQQAQARGQRVRMLEGLFRIRRSLELLADGESLAERQTLPADDFLRSYYAPNRPVVLRQLAATSHPVLKWTPEYLSSVIGDEPVEVMSARDSDADYEVNCETHRSWMPFADYVDLITDGRQSNDVYLVANNHFFRHHAAETLWKELDFQCDYLDPTARSPETVFLWLGSAGTVTPLHFDLANVLYVQVFGRKQFTLVSPLEGPLLYNRIGVYSPVDPLAPDYDAYPLFESVRPLRCVLEPGDALFLPVTWWHHVEAIEVSISLSFTNFAYPNTFHCDLPA